MLTEDQKQSIRAAIKSGIAAVSPPAGIWTPEDYHAVLSSVADDLNVPYDDVREVFVSDAIMFGGG